MDAIVSAPESNAIHSSGNSPIRVDLDFILGAVPEGKKVLDVGCEDGTLLALLKDKGIDGRGIELSQRLVNACVARGLFVVQGDADTDLKNYPDNSFDYVILSQTIQATKNPKKVLEELLRIGDRAIVSFPNFGHWKSRFHLAFKGRMPVTRTLPEPWYLTQNIHHCTIRDFVSLVQELGATVDEHAAFSAQGRRLTAAEDLTMTNLFASQAVFVLRR